MALKFTVFSIIFLASAVVSFFVAYISWKKRNIKSAIDFTLFMLSAGVWSLFVVFETAAVTEVGKLIWAKLEYLGAVTAPVFFFMFVIKYTDKENFIGKTFRTSLFILPALSLLLAFTNEWHHLIWSSFSPIHATTNIMEYHHGSWFWIGYVGYNYILLFSASILLLSFIKHNKKPFRTQAWILIAACFCPWTASIIYLFELNIIPGLDITPLSMILSGILLAYALFYSRIFELIPVARDILFDILPDAILVVDGKNRIIDLNEAASEIFEVSKTEVLGGTIHSKNENVMALFGAAIAPEYVDEYNLDHKDGRKAFHIVKKPIKEGSDIRIIILKDISDQLVWQNEVMEGEEKYANMYEMFRLLADNTDDFLWIKDLENKYIFCNKTMADRLLCAKDTEEPIGKTDMFFAERERAKHPEDKNWHTFGELCANTDTLVLQEKKQMQFDEYGNIRGQFLYLDVHKTPIRNEFGKIIGVAGTGRDVTQTKKIEEEKNKALEALIINEKNLKRINDEKDKFFSIIAHDLRSPFNTFIGFTQLMSEEIENFSIQEIQRIADNMKKSATNLYALLENLLQWSQLQRGLNGFEPEITSLANIIEECLPSIIEAASKKNIRILQDFTVQPKINADKNMIQSVIRNLASNAIKFTPKDGRVLISTQKAGPNLVEIEVKDTGIGMSPDMVDKLFKLHENTNRLGTEGEPSTGLGLILCKEFVEKHGGQIRVASKIGRGTSFFVTLPVQ